MIRNLRKTLAAWALWLTSKESNRIQIIQQALTVLENMEHRGGQGSEPNTGDGAGILLQIPHALLLAVNSESWASSCRQAANMPSACCSCRKTRAFAASMSVSSKPSFVKKARRCLAGVPFRRMTRSLATPRSRLSRLFAKCSSARTAALQDELAFERKLYVIRKRAEHGDPLFRHRRRGHASISPACRARKSSTKGC